MTSTKYGCKQAVKCYNNSAMTTDATPIKISNNPDLLRLAEEVAVTNKPRELIRDKKTVAVIMPVSAMRKSKKHRAKTKADFEAFLSAGSWKDLIDVEQFKKDIYESRKL